MIPKIWQTVDEDPDIYDAASRFIEAAGLGRMAADTAGDRPNTLYAQGTKPSGISTDGFPSRRPLQSPSIRRWSTWLMKSLSHDLMPVGQGPASFLLPRPRLTGLKEGNRVAVANVDAHVSVPCCWP